MKEPTFPCNACGACCRKVGDALYGLSLMGIDLEFPYDIRPDGSCSMLGADNQCAVYEARPLVCRVDKMIELFGMTKVDGYRMTVESCNMLKAAEGRTDFL